VKTCSKCGEEKAVGAFYRRRAASDGLTSQCRACTDQYQRDIHERRKLDPEYAARKAAAKKRYKVTQKGKEADRRYRQSEPGKKAARRQAISPTGVVRRRAAIAHQRITHPEKHRARVAVYYHRKVGNLVPLPCQQCGGTDTLHAHHRDYSRPLDVTWLCERCHVLEHRRTA
jgi:hypothetical protein